MRTFTADVGAKRLVRYRNFADSRPGVQPPADPRALERLRFLAAAIYTGAMNPLFLVRGELKDGDDAPSPAEAMNERLVQRHSSLNRFGRVLDEHGRVRELIGVVEADSLEPARGFLAGSPFYARYARIDVGFLKLEVGALR